MGQIQKCNYNYIYKGSITNRATAVTVAESEVDMMKTYYIWIKAIDELFGEYEFYDSVYGTEDELNKVLKSWKTDESVTVLGVTE